MIKNFQDLLIGKWGAQIKGYRFPCSVGRSGIGKKTHEGDGLTPEGVWRLISIMYRRDRLNLHTNNNINIRDTWSDDPVDPNYNKLGKPETKFSYEKLWRPDPIYDLIGITDYNWPEPKPGLGSAIFLHAWRKPRHPTEGCIAFSMNDLKLVFRLLENTSKIIIKS